jgi:UDP-4-amino-4-deoxy-L-arabinose formyltransferase/UDP-glucuronic acid dehydrogenase (UDP-4-keto-hexauronic acid decarboxylating)
VRLALIGRSEILRDAGELLRASGHEIALIVTAKEAPEYRVTAEDFRAWAQELGCAFIRSATIGKLEDRIRALPPIDLAISVNYPGIVPQPIVDCFTLGILNSHAGDLPRYRGNAPLAWAILQGEERVGLCIHKMVGGELDSGDIVARDYHPVTETTKIGALFDWVRQRTPELFADAADALARDADFVLERQSTDPADALRGYPRTAEDGRIDWSASTRAILRLVNASNRPFAGAFCTHRGERLIVWDAERAEDEERFLAVPGQVLRIGEGYADIATGDGRIRLRSVQRGEETCTPDRLLTSIRARLG